MLVVLLAVFVSVVMVLLVLVDATVDGLLCDVPILLALRGTARMYNSHNIPLCCVFGEGILMESHRLHRVPPEVFQRM